MGDKFLFCNFKKCNAPITKTTWVTRCSHVFCEEHGNAFLMNKNSKVKCPVCNESISRETDIIKTNLNPHDMMLCCVRPERALDYVSSATKVWSYQLSLKNKVNIELLNEKFEKIAANTMSKLRAENSEMKKFIKEIENQLKSVNAELAKTKRKLWKYKLAYNNLCAKNKKNPMDSEWSQSLFQKFSNDSCNDDIEDILQFENLSDFDDIMSPKFN